MLTDRRTDNIELWVGLSVPTQTLPPNTDLRSVLVYKHGIAGDGEIISIQCDVTGSSVSLYQEDAKITICEVEVYGKYITNFNLS